MSLTLDRANLKGHVEQKDLDKVFKEVDIAHKALTAKTGQGSEFTGWADLPSRIDNKFISDLVSLGKEVRGHSDCIVSIGIGGSYLGIRATLEFLESHCLPVYYAGHNMSSDHHYDLLEKIKDKRVTLVVISKSGTTTEPALAFRLLKQFMEKKYSKEELKKRIICVTDEKKGALRQIADQNGYRSFIIPDDVGGRFSILTPVGLAPLAIAGVDIQAFVDGAREGQKIYSHDDVVDNISYQYAAARYLLFKQGKAIEVTASFYPNLFYVIQWWKQLYGESEAKNGKGIFPSSMIMSTDLHSMGQLLQEGVRNVFETFLMVDRPRHSILIPTDPQDLDKFNIVAGKDLDYVNKQAYKATAAAHYEGGVPNMTIHLPQADAFHLGELFYFYERAVAISGYLLGINPFNQPGVEAYKKKMFELLGMK